MAIVDNQKNIKVHFAGAEQSHFARCLHLGGDVKYYLFTVFPMIAAKCGIKAGYAPPLPTLEVPKYIETFSRHTIMDSGLFTLMFGSHKGEKSEAFLNRWYEELVNYVNVSGYKGTCVEVDCQKVLGVEKAWEFRQRMKLDLPNNRQINVFHLEDGMKGLDKLIDFSDYIAVSVPELRANGKKDWLVRITNYIKGKKPNIDIHLLGMTEKNLMKELSFASTCDSTSWTSLNRWGRIGDAETGGTKNVNLMKEEAIEKYYPAVEIACKEHNINLTDARLKYLARYAFSGDFHKKLYTKYGGCQD